LHDGTFSADTLKLIPLSYQTTDSWFELLQASATKYGMTWLHALHIGIGAAERGEISRPLTLFQQSMDLYPNPIAARNMAVLQSTAEDAWKYYQLALEVLSSPDYPFLNGDAAVFERLATNLVTEMAWYIQQNEWYDRAPDFIKVAPACTHGLDAYVTLLIKYYTYVENYADAKTLLAGNCFPTYAKARSDLMDMWQTVVEGIAQQQKGEVPLTSVEKHQARKASPIPDNIGCQYASEYCENYW